MNICQTTILLNNGKHCKGKSKRFKRKFQGFSGLFCFSMSNSSVQFEDSTLTSENTAVSVQYNGYLNLNGGSITRKSGTHNLFVFVGYYRHSPSTYYIWTSTDGASWTSVSTNFGTTIGMGCPCSRGGWGIAYGTVNISEYTAP